jgi:hypothetical protein
MNAPQLDDLRRVLPPGAKPSAYSLALNFLPFLHLLAGAVLVWAVDGAPARVAAALAWIYLLPPLASRIAMQLFGTPQGEGLDQNARAFKVWWFLVQWQVLFNRFGFLEELLRMVPGLYALWLNLWGARVSPLVYWGSGAAVVDRPSVRIAAGAVIGTRAVLAGHLAVKGAHGEFLVTLAPVEIGERALIGAYAGIAPGCRVAAGEEVPAATFLRPHTYWSEGRRARPQRPRTS